MPRYKITREFYLTGKEEEIRDDEANAVAYLKVYDDRAIALGFGGRRQRPDFNYRFRNEQLARAHIQKYFDGQRRTAQFKTELRREQREFKTSLEVGDVLYTSWGYDQTNVDWYQVVEVKPSGKTVVVREICGEYQQGKGTATYSGYTMPVRNRFAKDSELMTKRVRKGDAITVDKVRIAWKWDGQRKYWSDYH